MACSEVKSSLSIGSPSLLQCKPRCCRINLWQTEQLISLVATRRCENYLQQNEVEASVLEIGIPVEFHRYSTVCTSGKWKFYGRTVTGHSMPSQFLKYRRNFSKIPVGVPTGTPAEF